MTPQEQHQDAVEAAHEWRDEQRAIPRRGEHIVIRWPNGPRDYEMAFYCLDDRMPAPHEPGWLWLRGHVGEHDYRTIYARPISPGEYEMVPFRGPAAGA